MRKLNIIQFSLLEVKEAVVSHYKLDCDPREAVFVKEEGCSHCENKFTDSDQYEISWKRK